jgi:hypothetical protein
MAFNNKASYRLSVAVVEFRHMPEELSVLPLRRALAWAAIGVLIAATIVPYFVQPACRPHSRAGGRRHCALRPMSGNGIRVTLPDGSETLLAGATAADLAKATGPGLARRPRPRGWTAIKRSRTAAA